MSTRTLDSGRGRSTAAPIVFPQKRHVQRICVVAAAPVEAAQPHAMAEATTPAPVSAAAPADAKTDPDLDVLFIGAHPDDEAFGLATYGQWNEYDDIQSGVITITRGEGGGNAVGPEEGPALGLMREAEERRAVARAGS